MKNKNFHVLENRDINKNNASYMYLVLGTVFKDFIYIYIVSFNPQNGDRNSTVIIGMPQMRRMKRLICPRSHG